MIFWVSYVCWVYDNPYGSDNSMAGCPWICVVSLIFDTLYMMYNRCLLGVLGCSVYAVTYSKPLVICISKPLMNASTFWVFLVVLWVWCLCIWSSKCLLFWPCCIFYLWNEYVYDPLSVLCLLGVLYDIYDLYDPMGVHEFVLYFWSRISTHTWIQEVSLG